MKACEEFLRAVHEELRHNGGNWDAAWNTARRTHASVYRTMLKDDASRRAQFSNSAPASASAKKDEKARSEAVTEFINEAMKASPWLTYDDAFKKCQRERKDLFAAMHQPARLSTTFSNNAPPPVAGPQNRALLGLPIDASQQEFEEAYAANGNSVSTRDAKRTFNALVKLIQRTDNVSEEEARARAKERYTQLWQEMEKS